ncbi:MAG: TrkH family potassium uptake protein [Oscillospiraceae bacterium]|nr:TrkH family potassium uptake protein [Oscillospiraceae bacterium]
MNHKMIGRFIAQILSIEGAFMIPALLISLGYSAWSAAQAFLITIAVIAAVCAVLFLVCKKAPNALDAREGMICVGISWIILSLFGCLPFVISGEIPRYIDAFFEIVSGFTTTGSSILSDVEALSPGILYWRSFSHWLGGMGVLVFLLAVAPGSRDKGFTMHLLRAESPGPDVGKLVPKMRKTASILYLIYIVMTFIDFLLLLLGDMPCLDALCTAFGTAGTGGFGIRNDSMASYSPYIQYVTAIFMFLFGINFSCYYLLLLRHFKPVFRDEELRTYFLIVAVAIGAICLNVRHMYGSLEETFRHASFTVSTIVTTTGYGTTDFDRWPAFSKGIIMLLMVVGACAGSTGGGLKISRLLYLLKSLGRNITQILNPRRVKAVRYNGQVLNETVLANTNAYLVAYVFIIIGSYLLVSLDDQSIGTTFTAVLACFNNIGPGLEAVGPTCNFSHLSDLSKLVLSADMLAGRLEIFPILVLFSPATWKK